MGGIYDGILHGLKSMGVMEKVWRPLLKYHTSVGLLLAQQLVGLKHNCVWQANGGSVCLWQALRFGQFWANFDTSCWNGQRLILWQGWSDVGTSLASLLGCCNSGSLSAYQTESLWATQPLPRVGPRSGSFDILVKINRKAMLFWFFFFFFLGGGLKGDA